MNMEILALSTIFVLLPTTVLSQQCNARVSQLGCADTQRNGNTKRMCYHAIVDPLTWIDSRQQCECRGWQLAKSQTAAIQSVLPPRSRDVWLDAKLEELSWWFWLTGTEYLDNVDGTEKCGYLDVKASLNNNDFPLKGALCGEQYKYICRNSSCTSATDKANTDCFYVSSATATWHKASQLCKGMGLEFGYRDDTTSEKFYSWNELSQLAQDASVDRVWVGARRADWMWQGPPREPLVYSNFAPNEPGTANNRCFFLRTDGLWVSQNCDQTLWGMCESAATENSEPVKVNSSQGAGNELALDEQGVLTCYHPGIQIFRLLWFFVAPSGETLLYNSSTGVQGSWQNRAIVNRNADKTDATITKVVMGDSGTYVCQVQDSFNHGTKGTAAITVIGPTTSGQSTTVTSQATTPTIQNEASTTDVTTGQTTRPTVKSTTPLTLTTKETTTQATTTTSEATTPSTSNNNGNTPTTTSGNNNSGNNGKLTPDTTATTAAPTTSQSPCQANPPPCGSREECTPDGTSFKCTCLPCFTGADCELEVTPPCRSNPCKNNGACSDTCSNFTCSCTVNFHGETCQFDCTNIVSITQDQTVRLGQATWFYCTASSASHEIKWKNAAGTVVSKNSNLTLTNVHSRDAGKYTCEVTSSTCTSSKSVTVATFYDITPNTTQSNSVSAKVGENIRLNCSATGDPMPFLYWIFRGTGREPTTIGNVETANENNLDLTNFQPSSSGVYECRAKINGEDLATVQSVAVTVDASDNNNSGQKPGPSSGASTSGESKWKWWHILLIVLGVLLLLILIIVIIVVICKGSESSVSPANQKPKPYESEVYIPPGAKVATFDSRPPPVEESHKQDEDYGKYSRLNNSSR